MTQTQEIPTPNDDVALAPSLTFEAACALLKGQGRLISPDDVELVVLVALQNEFLRLQFDASRELMTRHNEAMIKIMSTSVRNMKSVMEEERTAFSSAVRAVALENVTALISQHQKDLAEHGLSVRLCTKVLAIMMGLMSVGVVFVFGRLLV